MPYPGFPTDAGPVIIAMLTKARGTSVFAETIFENRFLYVPELIRMGANIKIDLKKLIESFKLFLFFYIYYCRGDVNV